MRRKFTSFTRRKWEKSTYRVIKSTSKIPSSTSRICGTTPSTVVDHGVQVPPEKFVEKIQEHNPDIVGFSAFLTTTMPMFKANINALQKAGLRDQVIVMVGGAPVTQEYADAVGADGYAADASATVKKAKDLLNRRRALVDA